MNISEEDVIKYNLTVGQMLGMYPLYSKLPIRYQYKSKIDRIWKFCKSKWDMERYKKYLYETRIV